MRIAQHTVAIETAELALGLVQTHHLLDQTQLVEGSGYSPLGLTTVHMKHVNRYVGAECLGLPRGKHEIMR